MLAIAGAVVACAFVSGLFPDLVFDIRYRLFARSVL